MQIRISTEVRNGCSIVNERILITHQSRGRKRWFSLIGCHDDEPMNPGLFVIEHFLGPERSRTRLHVKILAGVDKSGVQFGSEDGRRNVTAVRTVAAAAFRFPVEVAIVPEDHQARNICGEKVIKIIYDVS